MAEQKKFLDAEGLKYLWEKISQYKEMPPATSSTLGSVKISNGDVFTVDSENGLAAGMGHTHSNYLPKSGGIITGTLYVGSTDTGTADISVLGSVNAISGFSTLSDVSASTFTENGKNISEKYQARIGDGTNLTYLSTGETQIWRTYSGSDNEVALKLRSNHNDSLIHFANKNNKRLGYFGFIGGDLGYYKDPGNGTLISHKLWHSGNFTPDNKLDTSGGTMSGPLTIGVNVSGFGREIENEDGSTSVATISVPYSGGAMALTSDLDSYLPKSGGTIEGQTVMKFTESTNQANILSILSTKVASGSGWKGRLIVGAKDKTFLLGTYNNMCAIGAHGWSDAFTASGAAWEDVYFNPDGSANVYIGGSGWRAGSGTMKIANTIGGAYINTGSWSSPTWSQIATQTWVTTQISNLVNSAPEALNTLGELATALENHEDAYDALLSTVGGKLDKSGGSFNDSVDVTWTKYNRKMIINGNNITFDPTADTGTYAGSLLDVKHTKGTTTAIGVYGNYSEGLTHIFMGGSYSDPAMKMDASGNFTFKNAITLPVNKPQIQFRSGHINYDAVISYGTDGNEAMVFSTKNVVTSFMFVNGEDTVTNMSGGRWQSLTPGLQIKNNCVSIGKLIANNVTPTYKLDVNGTLNATTLYENGTALSNKYLSKSGGEISGHVSIDSAYGIKTDNYCSKSGEFLMGWNGSNFQLDQTLYLTDTTDYYIDHDYGTAKFSELDIDATITFANYGYIQMKKDENSTYEYEFPKESGTFALTSDLDSYLTSSAAEDTYLPLSGGEMSGDLHIGDKVTLDYDNGNFKCTWMELTNTGNLDSSNYRFLVTSETSSGATGVVYYRKRANIVADLGLLTTSGGTIKGDIIPDTNTTYDLGSSTKKFNFIYADEIELTNVSASSTIKAEESIELGTAVKITDSGITTTETIQAGTIQVGTNKEVSMDYDSSRKALKFIFS